MDRNLIGNERKKILMEEWYSVKSGNPNLCGRYLVVCKDIDTPQIRIYKGAWDSLEEVTHWMELPKMPKDR